MTASLKQVAFRSFRAMCLLWGADQWLVLTSVATTVVLGGLPPVQLWLTKLVLDALPRNGPSEHPEAASAATMAVGALVALWIVANVVSVVARRTGDLLAFKSEQHIRGLVLQKNGQLDLAFFDHPEFYNGMNNALQQTGQTEALLTALQAFAQALLGLLGTLAILALLHPAAPLLLVLAVLPDVVVSGRFSRTWFDVLSARASGRRMAAYIAGLLCSREAVKEVTAFGLAAALLGRFSGLLQTFLDENRLIWNQRLRAQVGVTLVAGIGAGLVGFHVISRAASSGITIGDAAMYLGAVHGAWSGLSHLVLSGVFASRQTLFLGNLFAFLDLPADGFEGALEQPEGDLRSAPETLEEGFEFMSVTFCYPGSDTPVLKSLTFTIEAAKTTAIVGCNGAGKTTLAKLLMRLYDPTEGKIRLDGHDIRGYDRQNLRRQFAVVFQDFVRYNLTARENVGFGDVERMDDQECLEAAARRAGALELIEGLPDGWDTYLGRVFGNGVDPSIGQWQKIALARAFMRDAQIYILDEPTASLDAIAEREFYENVHELTRGKTTIFISHRFSTVRMADKIIVLDDGRIVEQGSHDELMALNGHYAEMFNAQAERYR